MDNCYAESGQDRFRDECLSLHLLADLSDARRVIPASQEDYQSERLHQGLGYRTLAALACRFAEHAQLESAFTLHPY